MGRLAVFALIAWMAGCQDYSLSPPDKPPVATPPGDPDDELGNPPNWQDCAQGFLGEYSNLTIDHPDVEPGRETPPLDPFALDWWDDPSYQEFSSGLDFGANWWPVDEGLAGDPAYFSVRWMAWLRAWSNTSMEFTLGSADDAWIVVNGDVVFADPGVQDFEPETYRIDLEAGQYPIEIRYAHRSGDSGFRFRVLTGDVSLCYAEYEDAE